MGTVSTHEQGITQPDAAAEQREIDAQGRASAAELECHELREEQRSITEREILADEMEHVADERDVRLDAREHLLDDRERRTDLQALGLADREDRVHERERAADEREIDEAQRSEHRPMRDQRLAGA